MYTKNQLARYARQFALKEIGAEGQKKLMQAKVLVIGAGALGSAALYYLAAAGVGTLGIADGDKVELSNLQRQILHRTERVGMEKTASARETLQALNPEVRIELYPSFATPQNIEQMIAPYDFVIDGTDRFETKFLINDTCVKLKKPYAHAGAVGFTGQAMTYVPGQGPCLRCILPEEPEGCETCTQAGVLGAVPGILGSIQASEAIKYLLQTGKLLTGRVLCVDALTMEFRALHCPKPDSHCVVCSKSAESGKENMAIHTDSRGKRTISCRVRER